MPAQQNEIARKLDEYHASIAKLTEEASKRAAAFDLINRKMAEQGAAVVHQLPESVQDEIVRLLEPLLSEEEIEAEQAKLDRMAGDLLFSFRPRLYRRCRRTRM